MKHELKNINRDQLTRCPIQLRPVVKTSHDYFLLKESLRHNGIFQPLLVRPTLDEIFEVIDGNHRYEGGSDLAWNEFPCLVRSIPDDWVLRTQIQCNSNDIQTKPIEYARALWRILHVEKSLTAQQIAHQLHRPAAWVTRMAGLVNLCEEAKDAVNKGTISVSIAAELARLPPQRQQEFLTIQEGLSYQESVELIRRGARQFKQSLKDARAERNLSPDFQPAYRPMKEVEHEVESPTMAGPILLREEARTPIDGWNAALRWVTRLDEESIQSRKKRREAKLRTETRNLFTGEHEE